MKDAKRIIRWVILLLYVLIGILVVVSGFIFAYLLLSWFVKGGDVTEMKPTDYQTLRYNSELDQESFGLSTLFLELGEEEYETSYDSETKTYTLLSSFGMNEYICTGTCFCEDGQERRSGTLVKNGVITLVAALTFAIGYKLATNQLEDDCKTQMSEECFSPSTIRSEIDHCRQAYHSEAEVEEEEEESNKPLEEVSDETIESKLNQEPIEYYCTGKCVENHPFLPEEMDIEDKKEIREDCDKIMIQGYYTFQTSQMFRDEAIKQWLLMGDGDGGQYITKDTTEHEFLKRFSMGGVDPERIEPNVLFDDEEVAARLFVVNQLHEFCTYFSGTQEDKLFYQGFDGKPKCVGYIPEYGLCLARDKKPYAHNNLCHRL